MAGPAAPDGRSHRTRVKICGITRPGDAESAALLGADAIGVVFARSPRNVDIKQAIEVLDAAPAFVNRVGIFADQSASFIWDAVLACRLDWVQLHGTEPPELPAGTPARILKSVAVTSKEDIAAAADWPADAWLLDAPPKDWQRGGTGEIFDWDLADSLPWPRRKVVIAGGLTSENVGEVIRRLHPGGVDVSSGVEREPGIKDPQKIAAFITAVRDADAATALEGTR